MAPARREPEVEFRTCALNRHSEAFAGCSSPCCVHAVYALRGFLVNLLFAVCFFTRVKQDEVSVPCKSNLSHGCESLNICCRAQVTGGERIDCRVPKQRKRDLRDSRLVGNAAWIPPRQPGHKAKFVRRMPHDLYPRACCVRHALQRCLVPRTRLRFFHGAAVGSRASVAGSRVWQSNVATSQFLSGVRCISSSSPRLLSGPSGAADRKPGGGAVSASQGLPQLPRLSCSGRVRVGISTPLHFEA